MLYGFFYVGMFVLFGIWCISVICAIIALDYHFWDYRMGYDLSPIWTIFTAPIAPIIAIIEIIFMIRDSRSS